MIKVYEEKIGELEKIEHQCNLKLYEYGEKAEYYSRMRKNMLNEIRSIIHKKKKYQQKIDKLTYVDPFDM